QMIRYNAARGKASPGDSGAGRHSDRNERRPRAVGAHWTEFEYLQPATYRSAARHPRPGSSDPDSKPLLLFRHHAEDCPAPGWNGGCAGARPSGGAALSRDAMVQAIARRPSRFFASLDHLLDAPRALCYRNELAPLRPGDAPGVADLRLAALF